MATEAEVAERKIALEEKKFAFEQSRHHDGMFAQVARHPMAIVALIGGVLSFMQWRLTETSRQQEKALAEANAKAEYDRQWRVALIAFLEKQRTDLFSEDEGKRQQAIAVLEVSFPFSYSSAVVNKLKLVQGAESKVEEDPQVVVAQLLDPLIKELDTSRAAFDRLKPNDTENETIIRDANRRARDMLVNKAKLVPPELRQDALQLIEHYDAWFAEYARAREGKNMAVQQANEPFVFAGPGGVPFPQNAEQKFREALKRRANR